MNTESGAEDDGIKQFYMAEIEKYKNELNELAALKDKMLIRDISAWVRTDLTKKQKEFLKGQGLGENEGAKNSKSRTLLKWRGFFKTKKLCWRDCSRAVL